MITTAGIDIGAEVVKVVYSMLMVTTQNGW